MIVPLVYQLFFTLGYFVFSYAFKVYLPKGYSYRNVTQYEDARCGPAFRVLKAQETAEGGQFNLDTK